MKVSYKIADIVFDATFNYPFIKNLCKNYEYDGQEKPKFSIILTENDIECERKKVMMTCSTGYLESLALFRKISENLILFDAIVFHGSCVIKDNFAYIFTAPSGTGKSTHVNFWRQVLGDRVKMLNDDKPIIRVVDGKVIAYGTPWQGKHNLGENISCEVKAICKLERGKVNEIEKISKAEFIPTFLNQTVRFSDIEKTEKLLEVLEKVTEKVETYRLKCNISVESALVSIKAMSGGL